jgi:acyl-homoserine lactone acylase PvdQ
MLDSCTVQWFSYDLLVHVWMPWISIEELDKQYNAPCQCTSFSYVLLMRTLGIYQVAQKQYAGYPEDAKTVLQAYSKGIRAFYASGSQTLSPEFLLPGAKPGGRSGVVWEPADSVGWGLMMALDLGGNWGQEISRLSVAKVLDTPHLWQLYPGYRRSASNFGGFGQVLQRTGRLCRQGNGFR